MLRRGRQVVFVAAVAAAFLSVAPTYGAAPEWFRNDAPVAPRAAERKTDPFAVAPAANNAPVVVAIAPQAAPPAQPGPNVGDPVDVAAPAPPAAPAAPAAPARPFANPMRLPGTFYAAGNGANYVPSGPSDYPATQFNTYAGAMARAAMARAMFSQALSDLDRGVRDYERRFERSPEMQQALAAERTAYNELNAVRKKALQSTLADQHYLRLAALRADLHEQIQRGRADKSLSQDQITAMAQVKLAHATEMHDMETDALSADPAVRDAQEKLTIAGARVSALRQAKEEAMRQDPQLLIARKGVEDARIARLTAEAYLQGTMTAAGAALDAYYYARTPYRGYWPTGYTGYGYGNVGYGYGGFVGY